MKKSVPHLKNKGVAEVWHFKKGVAGRLEAGPAKRRCVGLGMGY
jgi:hypothetical protein